MANDSAECWNTLSTINTDFLRGEANIVGIIGVAVFYAVIFGVGIFASWRGKRKERQNPETSQKEQVILAGRSMGGFVGLFTLTATAIGGGYINGTAETIFNPNMGLAWCQAPFFYTLGLIFNGLFFAKPMRDAGYLTLMDPFQKRYGRIMTALLYVPSMLGSTLWAGTILASLGATLSVIIGLSYLWAVVISSALAIIYTVVGGLYSVAYTDVIQLVCIFVGLWLAVPFAMLNEATTSIIETARSDTSWLGQPIRGTSIMVFIDYALLLVCGGMPWQEYFQRALAIKTTKGAIALSIGATFLIWFFTIPAALLGAVAASTDWNATEYVHFGDIPVPSCDYPLALPMVMRFLTPMPVAIIGMGAVSAAVMSSTDSAILATSTMFAVNIYTPLRDALTRSCCKRAKLTSDKETVWVMRVTMLGVGAVATIVAITASSIYGLFVLLGDLVYVILFPQFVCVVHIPFTNSYGSFVAYWVCLFFRMAGGEPYLNLPPLIKYPYYNEEEGVQEFPFRTMCMLIALFLLIVVSLVTREFARRFPAFRRMDEKLFGSFVDRPDDNFNLESKDGKRKLSQDGNVGEPEAELLKDKKEGLPDVGFTPERENLMKDKEDQL